MAGKRGHCEGSVYWDRNRWVAAVSYVDAAGKRRRVFPRFKTQKEANKALRELLHRYDRGEDLTSQKQTVAEFGGEWLERHFRKEESTRASYEAYLRLHVYPHIGGMELRKVTGRALANLYH